MAGIPLADFILWDRWPGQPNTNLGVPANGWDNTTDCFKTTASTDKPSYPLGTKITAYTDNSCAPGWYTMIYLMYHSYEAAALYDISKDFSDGHIWCTHADGSTAQLYSTDFSTIPYYVVSQCLTKAGSDVSTIAAVAIPCWTASSDATAAYTQGYGDSFGWFWCGGVCPCKDATLLDGTVGSGYGACVTGQFATVGKGPVWIEYSAALGTIMWTCDPTNAVADATTTYTSRYSTPAIGWVCSTAV